MQKRRKKEAEIVRLEAEAMTAMTEMQQLSAEKGRIEKHKLWLDRPCSDTIKES